MDVLNPREVATLIWFVLIFGFLIWKAKAWGALMGVAHSLCKPLVLRVVAMMGAWVAGCAWLLWRYNLWGLENLKTTIVWFVTFAVGWMFNLKRWEADPGANVRSTLKQILGVTTFVTFLTEFYTFDLFSELILVPVVSLVALVGTFAQGRKGHEAVAQFFGGLLAIFGLGLLSYAAYRLVSDLRGFAIPETGREFAVPAFLSLLFIPFMYVVGVWAAYGQVLRTLQFSIKDESARRFAKQRAFLWFGLDVALLRRWRWVLFRVDTCSREKVSASVAMMKAARRRERLKQPVPFEFGWSPYEAVRWLRSLGLDAGDYDPSFGEWSALSPSKELSSGVLGDTLRYQVTGTEEIATKLVLTFARDSFRKEEEKTPDESISAFAAASFALLFAVFGDRGLEVSRALTGERKRAECDGVTVGFVEEDDRSKLVIRHPMHVEVPD